MTREDRKRLILFLTFALGVVLILVGNIWVVPETAPGFYKILPKIVHDLGIALLIAPIVSRLFDMTLQHLEFVEPVKGIQGNTEQLLTQAETRAQELTKLVNKQLENTIQKVGDLNSILKSSSELKITALYQRNTDPEMKNWRERVTELVSDAEKYVYIAGRTLNELFPTDVDEQPMITLIESKLQQKPIEFSFVFANPYDQDSHFRTECKQRRPQDPSGIWQQAIHSIEQVLNLKYDERIFPNQKKLNVKIHKDLFPFVIVITDKSLIVQHYLPFINGRYGITIEVLLEKTDTDPNNLHNLYKKSFEAISAQAEEAKLVFERYILRKPKVIEKIQDLLKNMGIQLD